MSQNSQTHFKNLAATFLSKCLSNKCKKCFEILVLTFFAKRWVVPNDISPSISSFMCVQFSQTWLFQNILIHLKCCCKKVQQHWESVHYKNLTKYVLKRISVFLQYRWRMIWFCINISRKIVGLIVWFKQSCCS